MKMLDESGKDEFFMKVSNRFRERKKTEIQRSNKINI